MIDYLKIFQFRDALLNKPFRGVILNYDFAGPEVSRGEKKVIDTVSVKHAMGGKIQYDVVWTTNAFPLIVSERVINLFESNSISGWKSYEVEIYSKKNELIDQKYFGLIITGRCGYQDYSKSSIVMDKIGITMEPHIKGFYFKDDFWDGTDLFMCQPDKNGGTKMYRFCTEKVVELFKKENVKNVSFQKITDFTLSIPLYEIELTKKQILEIENLKTSGQHWL